MDGNTTIEELRAALVDDSRKVVVEHGRAPAEMEADCDLIPRGDLVLGALASIGAAAVEYFLQKSSRRCSSSSTASSPRKSYNRGAWVVCAWPW